MNVRNPENGIPALPRVVHGRWLLGIVVVYIVVAVTYLLATPPLESSDEYKHYPVVHHIQTQLELPVLDPEDPGLWLQEAAQPPLYYLIMALVTAAVDTSDLNDVHYLNPHAFVGNPNQIGNKNLIIHQPALERFPGKGTILAIHVIRMASIVLGVGTVLLTARLGSLLISPQIGLFAAALTAFNPMFLFVSAAVNNDSLAIMLGHAALLLLVLLWQDDSDSPVRWRRTVALGVVLGLGLLTKLSLGAMVVLMAAALAWRARRKRSWRSFVKSGSMIVGLALAISGWWFVRNLAVYGDVTGLNVFYAVQESRESAITWSGWLDEFGTFFRSYWGLFGGVNVAAPNIFYTVLNLAALVGGVGLIIWWRRKRRDARPGIWLLPLWSAILMILLLYWNTVSHAFQGRLIFPALGALNVMWAIGLAYWVPQTWRARMMVGVVTPILIAAVSLPWISIRPAYVIPAPVSSVPESARFGPINFTTEEGVIQLVGVEMAPHQTLTPGGGPAEITLYWQVGSRVNRDYVSSIHLLGRRLRSEGQVDRYPASGMIPTSRWLPGQIYRDEYHVYVGEKGIGPAQLRVSVTIFDDEAGEAVPAAGPDGSVIDLLLVGEVVRLAAGPGKPPEPDISLDVPFEEGITLAGYDLERTAGDQSTHLGLTLYWKAAGTPSKDYTVFVHLLDSKGNQVGGADAPPVGNDYPTSLWQAGDWIDDLHLVSAPVPLSLEQYWIGVGLYDPVSGTRLARADGVGDTVRIPVAVVD